MRFCNARRSASRRVAFSIAKSIALATLDQMDPFRRDGTALELKREARSDDGPPLNADGIRFVRRANKYSGFDETGRDETRRSGSAAFNVQTRDRVQLGIASRLRRELLGVPLIRLRGSRFRFEFMAIRGIERSRDDSTDAFNAERTARTRIAALGE